MTLTATLLLLSLSQKAPQPKVQHVSFDADELIVERAQPELDYIYARRPTKFANLIKIRANFADKIVKSVDQM